MDRGQRIELLGVPFDGVTMRAAVGRCLEWCAAPRASHTVITMNAATLCKMRRDPELKKACLSGDLIVPDGMPFVWASRLARVPLPERVAGVDLMAQLLSGMLMLRHLEEHDAADRLESAIAEVIREGKSVTYDMKPTRDDPTAVGTSEVADAIVGKLGVRV